MPEPKIIKTRFDQEVNLDVALEMVDGKEPAVATTLKNAENIYKSYLYIRKMYTGSLSSAKVLGVGNVSNSEYETITIPEDALNLRISNTSNSASSFKINDGEYIMQPGETIELPVVAPSTDVAAENEGDKVELKGTISYILYISAVV